jgi:hypothetical protein
MLRQTDSFLRISFLTPIQRHPTGKTRTIARSMERIAKHKSVDHHRAFSGGIIIEHF